MRILLLEVLINYLNGKGGLGGSAGSAWPPRGSDASLASFIVSAWLPGVVVAGLTGCPTLQYVWLCVLTGIIKDRPARLKTFHLLSAFVHCVSFVHRCLSPLPSTQNFIGATCAIMYFLYDFSFWNISSMSPALVFLPTCERRSS